MFLSCFQWWYWVEVRSEMKKPFWLWNVTTLDLLVSALAEVFLEMSPAWVAEAVETAVAMVTGASTCWCLLELVVRQCFGVAQEYVFTVLYLRHSWSCHLPLSALSASADHSYYATMHSSVVDIGYFPMSLRCCAKRWMQPLESGRSRAKTCRR